jgi:hypothetical protein
MRKAICVVARRQDEFGSVPKLKELYDSLECEKELVVLKIAGIFSTNI